MTRKFASCGYIYRSGRHGDLNWLRSSCWPPIHPVYLQPKWWSRRILRRRHCDPSLTFFYWITTLLSTEQRISIFLPLFPHENDRLYHTKCACYSYPSRFLHRWPSDLCLALVLSTLDKILFSSIQAHRIFKFWRAVWHIKCMRWFFLTDRHL